VAGRYSLIYAAAAGVGCFAAYEAAAKADGGYLMVAAPVVALAAALIPAYFDRALRDRQWLRGIVLFIVWVPCALTVFYTAAERVHLAKASGEAQRAALHQVVERAKAELAEANQAKAAATTAANRIRGLDGKACRVTCLSIKATEVAAISRAANAETALAAAEARAVTEASIKQPEWLQPLALDLAGIMLIGAGFGLGRKPAPLPVVTDRQKAARKGLKTKRRNKRNREKARKIGPQLAVSK
jgi:hypothetical protein